MLRSRQTVALLACAIAGLVASLFRPASTLCASFDFMTWATEERGRTPDAGVVVVAIDRELLRLHGFPGEARLKRDRLAMLLERISASRPRAIGLDIEFSVPRDESGDLDLVEAIARAGTVTVPEAVVTLPGDGSVVKLRSPIAPVAEAARHVGFVTLHPDADETVRRVTLVKMVNGVRRLHFSVFALARVLGSESVEVGADRLLLLNRPPGPPTVVPLDANASTWIRFTGDRPVPVIPGSELCGPSGPDARLGALLADRFVLVGGVEEIFEDHQKVPSARFDVHRPKLAGVVILGQIIANLLERRFLAEGVGWTHGLVLMGLALWTGWIATRLSLAWALAATGATVTAAVAVAIHQFQAGVLLDLVTMTLVTLGCLGLARALPGRPAGALDPTDAL